MFLILQARFNDEIIFDHEENTVELKRSFDCCKRSKKQRLDFDYGRIYGFKRLLDFKINNSEKEDEYLTFDTAK